MNKKSFGKVIDGNIDNREDRERIWYKAVIDGLEHVSKIEKMTTWDFLRSVDEIRESGTIDKLKMLSKKFG